ncbi:MAG: hypothetical protein ABIP95_13525 [Pelobium sp.]
MKKLILSMAFLTFAGIASAQTETKTTQTVEMVAQDSTTKTPVKLEELPDAVKATLASPAYKDWTPTDAFWVKKDGKEYYAINVKKQEEVGSVSINKDGTPVKD